MRKKETVLLLITCTLIFPCIAGYGDIQDSLPTQREREVLLMTNAVRMDPVGFRDAYIPSTIILLPENYPAVEPVWYNHALSKAAHFHSGEMATVCGMNHNSCDGTSFSTRVTSYYKSSSPIGENVAAGVASGIGTVIQWIRDDNAKGVPALDTSKAAGHRKNIMNKQYHEIGAGYGYSSTRTYNHFWTEDFGGGKGSEYKIPAGSHFLAPGNSTSLFFAANYFDKSGNAPASASVFIDGKENPMALYLGKAAAGTYRYSMAKDNKSHCYYFVFKDGAGIPIRYPETMTLSTGNEGVCSGVLCITRQSFSVRDDGLKEPCYLLMNGSVFKCTGRELPRIPGNLVLKITPGNGEIQKMIHISP